jgi:hypothetical protein
LLTQATASPPALAFPSAGNNSPAKIAIMAITTRSSIRVNATSRRLRATLLFLGLLEIEWVILEV